MGVTINGVDHWLLNSFVYLKKKFLSIKTFLTNLNTNLKREEPLKDEKNFRINFFSI